MTTSELHRLSASFATLAAITGWLVWLGLAPADGASGPAIPREEAPLARPLRSIIDERALSAIEDRPLFSRSRQPWHPTPPSALPVAPAPSTPPLPRLDASLVGIVMSPSGNTAIMRLQEGRSAILREGSILQGWTLKRVSPQRVLFASSMSEEEIAFAPHRGPQATQTETPAASPVSVRRRR